MTTRSWRTLRKKFRHLGALITALGKRDEQFVTEMGKSRALFIDPQTGVHAGDEATFNIHTPVRERKGQPVDHHYSGCERCSWDGHSGNQQKRDDN